MQIDGCLVGGQVEERVKAGGEGRGGGGREGLWDAREMESMKITEN